MKKSYKLNNGTMIYLTPEMYANHAVEIEALSDYLLKHCKNIDSIDVSDVSAGGIQIGGTHISNPGYIIMNKTINYDWSNINDIIREFIADWNCMDCEVIDNFNEFIKDGEKYGWD